MRYLTKKQLSVFLIAVIVCPNTLVAADKVAAENQSEIRNVELSQDGTVRGTIVDSGGNAVAGVNVELILNDGVRQVVSNNAGVFTASGLKGGPCIVKVGETAYGCRLWTFRTAPPKSLKSFVVVDQSVAVVRGNDDRGGVGLGDHSLSPLSNLSKNQLMGAGLAAGLVAAVVIAVANASD